MSFASKKEADAYDKMLDLAEVLNDWLVASPLEMDDAQRDTMAMWLAERKEALRISCASADCRSRMRPRTTHPRRRRQKRLLQRKTPRRQRPKRVRRKWPDWRQPAMAWLGRGLSAAPTFAHL